MTLKEALLNQGNTLSEVKEIISSMVSDVNDGCDPETVLEEQGLEPDYVMDLLNECL